MRTLIGPLCLLAWVLPLAAQTAPDSIDNAIAVGLKTKNCVSTRLVSTTGGQYGKSNYAIAVDGPMVRIGCRAAAAAKQHQAFARSMLTATDTLVFYAITAYPNGEIRPHLVARPSRLILKVSDLVVQPDSVAFDEVALKDELGAVLVVPRIVAYFLPGRWPQADFQIMITTSGPEYLARVGRSERTRIH